jgi:hypothetical protein
MIRVLQAVQYVAVAQALLAGVDQQQRWPAFETQA